MVHLHSAGHSTTKIAATVGCSAKTIRFWIREYKVRGNTTSATPSGRPSCMTAAASRRAANLLVQGCNGGARFVSRKLKAEGLTDRLVSPATVLRAAKKQAAADGDPLILKRGRPPKALSAASKAKRIQFAKRNRKHCWTRVMFTDRCKFHFRYPGCSVSQCRWLKSSRRAEDGAVMANKPAVYNVYGGLTRFGTTKLHAVAGTTGIHSAYKNQRGQQAKNITSSEYADVVKKTLLPEGRRIFCGQGMAVWTLQQDNDPTHAGAANVIAGYNAKRTGSVVGLLHGWPGNSPDLSPIENVWAYVDAAVARLGCKTFKEFKAAVHTTFENLPVAMCANLVASVPKRLSKCVELDGCKTGY